MTPTIENLRNLLQQERFSAYLAPEGFLPQLQNELRDVVATFDHLLLAKGPPQQVFWSQNIWNSAEWIDFSSIKEAVGHLRKRQKNWALYPLECYRRAMLIQAELPKIPKRPLQFPPVLKQPLPKMGSWTLLDKNVLLASGDCSSPFANGELEFEEDRQNPPNRAYLKLYEALTRIQRWPGPKDFCLDLGASPGGWTWVLDRLGAQVLAVDRSPLAPSLLQSKRISFRAGDAFGVAPDEFPHVDWLFCDVACYPEKLFSFVQTWVNSERCDNFVCTLKFQGNTHYEVIRDFTAIPHTQLMHLNQNKHELTWVRLKTPKT